ncbi:MAG: response regulator [Rhodospirillaceae bacterium]|nr:response regulator [Rhodospirillaceae bacterium]
MAKPRALPCLLVVEDEPAVRDLIVAFLKRGGHQKIVTAGNAEEALFYIFKDAGLDIKLAVVDLVLPNASGLALIRRIRNAKSPVRKALPVVVLTGRTDTDTYKAAARRGIQGYLMKPISPDLLVETVNKVLSARGIVAPAPLKRPSAPAAGETRDKNDPAPVAPPPSLDDNTTSDAKNE